MMQQTDRSIASHARPTNSPIVAHRRVLSCSKPSHLRQTICQAAVNEAPVSDISEKLSAERTAIQSMLDKPYKHGWKSEILSDTFPAGISEDVVRAISLKKVRVLKPLRTSLLPSAQVNPKLNLSQNEPDWMLQFRLKAYRQWLTMEEPKWSDNTYPTFNYQGISYYSEPKFKEKKQSLDEVDPELLRTFDKLGIPLNEQKRLSNVAVDAVFDSVSIATTFRADLAKAGVIFCSISEAIKEYPELIKKHMGSVVSAHHSWCNDVGFRLNNNMAAPRNILVSVFVKSLLVSSTYELYASILKCTS